MTAASCLYEGVVAHRRTQPARDFRHPLTMAYIDLDELPELLGGRLLRSSPGLMRFRRADYHGDAGVALADAVRDTVADLGGGRPAGPIRLLTHLRSLGHCFNPVSFCYCFDQAGRELDAVLLEVTGCSYRAMSSRSSSRVAASGSASSWRRYICGVPSSPTAPSVTRWRATPLPRSESWRSFRPCARRPSGPPFCMAA